MYYSTLNILINIIKGKNYLLMLFIHNALMVMQLLLIF